MARFVGIENTQTSPFAQNLVGGIVPPSQISSGVVRGDLQSENYVSSSRGWKIRRDGVIEALSIQIAGNSSIAGWNIDSTSIYQTGAVLSSVGYVSFGATPPTAYGNNVGAWLGFTGSKAKMSLYKDANNYFQWDGDKLLVKAANFTLDSSGNMTASSATFSGAITATSGDISGLLTVGGDANVKIDGANDRITISDGTNDRVLIGKF
jgi:hypothetical protein